MFADELRMRFSKKIVKIWVSEFMELTLMTQMTEKAAGAPTTLGLIHKIGALADGNIFVIS